MQPSPRTQNTAIIDALNQQFHNAANAFWAAQIVSIETEYCHQGTRLAIAILRLRNIRTPHFTAPKYEKSHFTDPKHESQLTDIDRAFGVEI